ncbi:plasmid stabilization protein [Thiosulfatimonas sediminis]|uniref:Toxin n=1 Tax=Thiosulfatimonas sediminis TaxID=2675054 RepID=A0A6F8PW83_9GAMM|nr:type II toxin-antitoxin system RelE/ParE family toxin [Thiosulfatimonas sediminis]BBP46297.1 plasmid stabilization protein [Thiosulfatimonas sediminis]
MREIVLTKEAENDLEKIARYTIENFGLVQAEKYYFGLSNAFDTLAQYPDLGLNCTSLKPDLSRFVYQYHTIYFTSDLCCLKVYRVLSQKQDPLRQFSE